MKRRPILVLSSTELALVAGGAGHALLPSGEFVANLIAKRLFARSEIDRRGHVREFARWVDLEQ